MEEKKPGETAAQAGERPVSWKRELPALLCLLAVLGLFLAAAGAVLTPKRYDYGSTWGMYRQEPENSIDVLFFGSSLVYCDIAPAVLYEAGGVTSYVMAGPEQTLPVTYRYVKEALKTQRPSAIFIEATALRYGRTNRNVKTNVTYMPWGLDRLIMTFEEADPEDRVGLLFPLYAFHDRWDDLTPGDWKTGLLGYEPDPMAGYTWLEKVRSAQTFLEREFPEDEENYRRNLDYAEKIVALCREQGVRPIFYLSPTISRLPEDQVSRMEGELTAFGADFVDFDRCFDDIGFDLETNFFDTLHLNYRGVQVFGRYLAERLPEWGVTHRAQEDTALWQRRVETFREKARAADQRPLEHNPNTVPES